jgi:outer membrane protein OmpA-like peptidoglycan-associated protein/opacity protein-like surface antigen
MTFHSKGHLGRVLAMLLATIALLCAFGAQAAAQDDPPAPKWELFGGYSFFYPGADIHGVPPLGLIPLTSRLESNPRGLGFTAAYNFNRWFGFGLDTSTHWGSGESTLFNRIDDAGLTNLSFGPKLTFRSRHFAPFFEGLVGVHRLMPESFRHVNKLGFMLGGGLDINVSRHIALRLIRADYVMSSYRYGPAATTPSTDIRGVRLQTGLVFKFGGDKDETPSSAACSVQPTEVFAGEPVTATATGSNFNPKRTVKYKWNGTGVKAEATEASAQIDTTGLQPGPYQVTATLSDGSKHGVASCKASITVKAPHPPEISCSSDPGSVRAGGTSTIKSNASSPDGRSLTYSYTASAGNITGNTSSATLDSRGAQPGPITVTCNVSDDRNPSLTASSTATVNVQALPPPPPRPDIVAIEKRLALHSIYFATAKPSEEKPDGGLLPSQEKTLSALAIDFQTYLQSKPDAHLTLEGHADPRGSVEYNQALSERRVDRTKRFLVGLGVPEASIQTKAFGKQENLTDVQVKDSVGRNPELSAEDRQRVLTNMKTIILASNRRVDVTLNIPGQASQESVREYPFNAADSLTLLDTAGGKKAVKAPARKKKATKKQ